MAAPFGGADFGGRNHLIQQIQLSQQQRATSTPYFQHNSEIPDRFQSGHPARESTGFHPDPYLNPLDYPGHSDPYHTFDSKHPATMTDYSRADDHKAFLSQTRVDAYSAQSYGGGEFRRPKADPYDGDGHYDGLSDPFSKLHIAVPDHYRDEPGRRDEDDTYLAYSRHGSMTDDDKMNETGKAGTEAEVMSEEEMERRLEELRHMHDDQVETIQRLVEKSNDVRQTAGARLERGLNGNPDPRQKKDYNSSDTESDTPANRYHPDRLHPPGSDTNNARQNGERYHRPLGPQRLDGDSNLVPPHPEHPPPHHPFHRKVHYPKSKPPQHFGAQPSSEPSYSRNASPGPEEDHHRAQSQPYLRLIHDSYDPNYDGGLHSGTDNPGVTFDRYARRATRASVLNKAEQLLNYRRQTRLESISEMRGHPPPPRQPGRNRHPHDAGKRTVAFIKEEEEGSADSDHSQEEDFQTALTSLQTQGSKGRGGEGAVKRSRLQQMNARMKKNVVVGPRGVLARRPARHKKVARRRPIYDDYDLFSSGTEEEDDDVVHYGPAMYWDYGRYETSRIPRPLPSPEPPGEQQEASTKKARRVFFFRNGDPYFKPRLVLIKPKKHTNFEKLLIELGQQIPTVAGVKYIFKWPEGTEIRSVTELENGCYYVCSSVNRLIPVKYGTSTDQQWKVGKVLHQENHLFTERAATQTASPPGGRQRPYVMTVVSNLVREWREKVILNPSTTQNFEDFLADRYDLVYYPPVHAIYTEDKPRVKVEGFSHLFRLLKDGHKSYLVCGKEQVPVEPKKRALLSSDSSNGSVHSKGSQRHSKQSKADIVTFHGSDTSANRRLTLNRTSEPLRCEIDGKKREFYAPLSIMGMDHDGSKPHKNFRLDWVYGFRGHDARQNLVMLHHKGELVYFVGSIVVLYDRVNHTQRHYLGHTEEVTCLALHPTKPIVASGQMAGKSPEGAAHVRVWHAESLATISVLGIGAFERAVTCVSFSASLPPHGLLLAIDDSERHVMSLWEWGEDEDKYKPLAQTKTNQEPVVYGCFFPYNESILVTFGKQHLYFWKVFRDKPEGPIRRDTKSGIFLDETPKFVTAVCFSSAEEVITGDSRGAITVWSSDSEDIFRVNTDYSETMRFAHKKSVSCLVMLSGDILLSGGGNEIKAWDGKRDYTLIIERVLPQAHGWVRKILPLTTSGVDGHMFVGTTRNLILKGTLQCRFKVVVQGHSEELWAVKSHPKERSFFTAGHDKTLVKWSAVSHHVIWVTRTKNPCTSMAVDPHGQLLAVGSLTGVVTLFSCDDGKERNCQEMAGKTRINVLNFSPDGKQLAVGCQDGYVHVCTVQDDGQLFGLRSPPVVHNSTFVKHLDWSSNGRYLQTVLGDFNTVFWDVSNMLKVKAMNFLRDTHWHTFSCTVGYPLVGAWRKMKRGEVISVASRSENLDLIVSGDNMGRLRLFKYPSTSAQSGYRQVKPFSSNVTAAEFMHRDCGVLVSGGSDTALMQFDLEDR